MFARYFFRAALIVAAVLSMVLPAHASGTVSSVPAYKMYTTYPSSAWYYGTNQNSICADWGVVFGSDFVSSQVLFNGIDYYCRINRVYNNQYTTAFFENNGQSCPVNSTGSPCTCSDPYISNAGGTACESAPSPPPPTTCSVYPVGQLVQAIGGLGNQPNQACVQNCLFNTGSGVSWGISPNRQWQSSGRSRGDFCPTNDAAASSENDPACPSGQSLNASGVCAPLAMCPYDPTIYAINVNCHAPLCATDVSLYASDSRCMPNPNGSASGVPAVVDCSVSPSAPGCIGAVSGVAAVVTGTPGTSGVYAAPTFGGSGGGVSGVGDSLTFDSVPDSVNLESKTVSVATITPVAVGGAGSCPAPSSMVLHGQTYYFEWTTYCNFANMIKPVLLAFAWLAAAGILVGGFVA